MCPICALFSLGGLGLLLGPLASFPLGRALLARLNRALPLTFTTPAARNAACGWQSLPPLP